MKTPREILEEVFNRGYNHGVGQGRTNDGETYAVLDTLAQLEEYYKPKDDIFIKHIQSHLKPNEEVICKICGRTAKEICND
jgi:hypothetical protein